MRKASSPFDQESLRILIAVGTTVPPFSIEFPFAEVIDTGGAPYNADIRGVLKGYAETLNKKEDTLNAGNEIEGFLFTNLKIGIGSARLD